MSEKGTKRNDIMLDFRGIFSSDKNSAILDFRFHENRRPNLHLTHAISNNRSLGKEKQCFKSDIHKFVLNIEPKVILIFYVRNCSVVRPRLVL